MDSPAVAAAPSVARWLLASLFLILVVGSIARSVPTTVWNLVSLGRSDAALTPSQRANLWTDALGLTSGEFAFYRRALRPGDRFYVETPRHPSRPDLRSRVLWSTSFALLPAVMVSKPAEADVVIAFAADPDRLGLHYTDVRRRWPVATARIDR